MFRKDLGPLTVMGFARYDTKPGVAAEDVVDAALNWQDRFLDKQDGIAGHCLLRNLNGGFADAMFAVDPAAMQAMNENFENDGNAKAMLGLLDPGSIRLTSNIILKDGFTVPEGFSCIEFGTFSPADTGTFSEAALRDASAAIEDDYLSKSSNVVDHFMGRIDDTTYSEVAFGRSLGRTRRTCQGYADEPVCGDLLAMFDPDSVDLDFWTVIV